MSPISSPSHADNLVLTDSTLRSLGKACRDLQQVYLAGCSRVTDQGLRALGSLKKLQLLNIADCSRCNCTAVFSLDTQHVLQVLLNFMSTLHHRVSDLGVRYIIEHSAGSQLRELNLTNCIKISDVSLLRMSQQ